MGSSPRERSAPRATPDPTSSFDRFVLWSVSTAGRLARVWRALSAKRRLAAYAALGLFIGLFLPWYSQTVVATGRRASVQPTSVSLSGWDAFSLVQTVVLLISVGVLVLLFERGEGRTFRVPGGDGGALTAGGALACLLIVWAIFERPGASAPGQYTTATGVQWGIFIVLALAALLTYAGSQIRADYLEEARARASSAPARPAAPDVPGPSGRSGRPGRRHPGLEPPAVRPAHAGVHPAGAGRHANQGLDPPAPAGRRANGAGRPARRPGRSADDAHHAPAAHAGSGRVDLYWEL